MDGGGAADDGVVADLHMAAHDGVVGDDDAVAEQAIMRDVDDGHQHTVVPHLGQAAASGGAAMDGDVFAHQGAGADFGAGGFTLVFQVLRGEAHGAEREQRGARADVGVAIDDNVGDEFGAILDHHIRADGAERADFHPGPELRPGGDDGERVDLHGG